MTQVYRNVVKGFALGRLMEIAKHNAEKYNETWYVIGDSQIAGNDKARKGLEQYPALAFEPDGLISMIEAQPIS